jgi:hypothetical protein
MRGSIQQRMFTPPLGRKGTRRLPGLIWRAVELVLYPVLGLTTLVVFFYPVFLVPEPLTVLSLPFALFGMVICFYIAYFVQRPGIYKSKSPLKWLWHILATTTALALMPILGIVAEVAHPHVLWHFFAGHVKLNTFTGLDLRFQYGELVRLRSDALSFLPPNSNGRILRSRLLRKPDLLRAHTEGTILYLVQWKDGSRSEIPEQFLKEV